MKLAAPALLALLIAPGCSASTDSPEPQQESIPSIANLPSRPAGPILDQADILPPAEEARLDRRLRDLSDRTGDAVVVVSLNSLEGETIEDYATATFNDWGIGTPGGRGLLVMVAPNERRVRIEVGCGAESSVPDAAAAKIIEERMLPRFRESDFPGGTLAGVDALIARLALARPANDPGPHSELCRTETKEAA